jgi:CubicO group peptidase (beta-lactamase class C family)
MTATLAAMLVEEGKLTWTRTIAEAFPELQGRLHPQYAGVTLRQLLAHMGGAPANPPPAVWERALREQGTPTEQRSDYATGVLTQAPEAAPGSRFIYSNQGFVIAGVMIERAAGQPWETLMRARLFTPLGMTSAGFGSPATPGRVDQPWGHADDHGTLTPTLVDNPIALGPAGRVHASLDDLARYARFHLRGDRAAGRPPLLAPETLRLIHTPRDQEIYGFGWVFVTQPWTHGPALSHAGSNNSWFMSVWIAPGRDGALVVATNAGGPSAEAGAREAVAELVSRWF